MPRAKTTTPGIGRPLTELRASVEGKLALLESAILALHPLFSRFDLLDRTIYQIKEELRGLQDTRTRQLSLSEAQTKLAEAVATLALQLLANPPTRTAAVAETLARMGQAQPISTASSHRLVEEDAMVAPDAGQIDTKKEITVPTREYLDAMKRAGFDMSWDEAQIERLKAGKPLLRLPRGVDAHPLVCPDKSAGFDPATLRDDIISDTHTQQVPRGTKDDIDPLDAPYDPTAMASELALMAAEDDEPPPPPDEWEMWSRRLSTFRGQRMWLPDWGPRPGQDGCRVPYEMLNGGGR